MGGGRRPHEPVKNSQITKKVETPITDESLYVFYRTYTIAIRYFVWIKENDERGRLFVSYATGVRELKAAVEDWPGYVHISF